MAGLVMTERGDGAPAEGMAVVLLHSLLADAGSWSALADQLAGSIRLIVPNLPGFGGSEPVLGGLPAIAGAVADAIRTRQPGRAVAVVGNGFGGFVALRLALDHPDLVSRLVLIGTGARFSDPGRAAFTGMRTRAASAGLAAIAETAMARLFQPDFAARNPEMIGERRAAFLRTDPAMFTAACAALESLDISAEAGRIACPTLILAGAEDQATPPAMAEGLAALIPGAQLQILDGLAHVPQMQDPARIAQAMTVFLDLAR
ncbi:MAG TPA: alpha/beta fold hydrolase [Rhodopila sp.]|nr:alpha/beta fold hydrolase [Rhodopila sp.]